MNEHSTGPLGQTSEYPERYDTSVLHPIPRAAGRAELQLDRRFLPFQGMDIWNAYELSWLNEKGKPQVALMKLLVGADSENIVESKSLKLYLGSFNGSRFDSQEQVRATIEKDLSQLLQGEVQVRLDSLQQGTEFAVVQLPGLCIDELDVEADRYLVDAELLRRESDDKVEETLHSHLMRSCCPVTGQPDWASIMIQYQGPKISHSSLLQYIISYRNNQEFHEQCVERVFMDIWNYFKPKKLIVHARYTRRGGIDINPYRSSEPVEFENMRLIRQ